MKMHLPVCSMLVAFTLIPFASADPILPYQQPIQQQLTTDIAGGAGDLNTLNKALNAYQKASRSLNGDISILRNLNELLADQPSYPALIVDAANAYGNDFQGRREALAEQLRPAPRSSTKTSANLLLVKIDKGLSNAVNAVTTAQEISALQSVSSKLATTSTTVQRALRAPIGLSSMVARIGSLSFQSTRGFIVGGTNFYSTSGTGVGAFENGVLSITAVDNGSVVRGLSLHVEGITANAPATYPLGAGENRAFYDATDLPRRREYHFEADNALSNGTVPNAFVTIDFIGTNYVLGRFAFVGTNSRPVTAKDTNTLVTVSQGEFQLNFSH